MPDDGLPDMRGQMTLQYEDGKFSLQVTGPQWPNNSNINPTATISYDPAKKKFSFKPGLSSTGRLNPGVPTTDGAGAPVYDKDYDYDLTDLPDDLKKYIGNGPHHGPPAALHAPDPNFLWLGDHWMTYQEYNMNRKVMDAMPTRPAWYTPPAGGVDLFAFHAGSILYPPMPEPMFNWMVCKARDARMSQMFK